jgi:hypothetical protein
MTTNDIRIDHRQWVETVARSLRGDCASLTNPLHLEMVASAALGSWGDGDALAETRDPFFLGMIDALEDAGDPHSLAFLRGLAAIATPVIADPSRAAADRIEARGVTAPDFVDGLGGAQPKKAWLARNPAGGDQHCVFIEFAYPAAYDHLLAVFVDEDGHVKYIAVCESDGEAPMPDMDVEEICFISAGGILMEALAATDPVVARDSGEIEQLKLGALAAARVQRIIG